MRLKSILYRGASEIGGTLLEITDGITRIVIDAGLPLPSEDLQSTQEVLPKIEGLFFFDRPTIDAVIISHSHPDHYGLLPFIHDEVPIYMSAGTEAIIQINEKDKKALKEKKIQYFESENIFSIRSLKIKSFLMDHSAFDAYAFEIKNKESSIIYTGDFRSHGRKPYRFENFIKKASKNADVLFLEGTNIGRRSKEAALTEKDVEDQIVYMLDNNAPALFQCSAQNIDRLVSFYKAAARKKRWLVIDIHTAQILTTLSQLGANLPHPSLQYPLIKVFYPFHQTRAIHNKGQADLASQFRPYYISKSKIYEKQNNILMMVRPSFMIDLKKFGLQNGRCIYSLWQGYRSLPAQKEFEGYLNNNGFAFEHIHTSGHASYEALEKVVSVLHPKKCIPIHTAFPDKMKDIYPDVQVVENNQEIFC